MNVTIPVAALRAELKMVRKVINETKPTIPVLGNVLLRADGDRLTLYGTNLEIGLLTSCPATVTAPGVMTLPIGTFMSMATQAPGDTLQLTLDKHHARLISGTFKSRLQTLDASDYPTIPTGSTGPTHIAPIGVFQQMIRQVKSAIAAKPTVRHIDGALLMFKEGIISMVTLDGPRLAATTAAYATPNEVALLVPRKILEMLLELPDDGLVLFSYNEHALFFTHAHRTITSRILEGTFPNFKTLLAKAKENPVTATINRLVFAAALRRVGLTSEDTHTTRFVCQPGHVSVSAVSASIGEASEDVPLLTWPDSAAPITLLTSWRHVLDFLEHASGETITMALKDGETPMLLTDSGSYLTMVSARKA